MVLVVMVFQFCVTTLPSCGVGGNGVSVFCNQVVVLVVMVFQCCVTTGCGSVFQCNHSAKLWCWW